MKLWDSKDRVQEQKAGLEKIKNKLDEMFTSH